MKKHARFLPPQPPEASGPARGVAAPSCDGVDVRAVLDADPTPVAVIAPEGKIHFVNAAWDEACSPSAGFGSTWEHPLQDGAEIHLAGAEGQPVGWRQVVRPLPWGGAPAALVRLHPLHPAAPAEVHLRRANQLYAALLQTTAAVARALDETELFEDVCRIAVACAGFSLAWIGRPSRDGTRVQRVAAAGARVDYLESLHISLDPTTSQGQGPIARTLRLGVPYVCNDFAADALTGPWRESAARHGIGSFVVCPVRSGGRVDAVFAVYSDQPGFFESDLLTLLNQLALEVSAGLDRQTQRRARRQAERALAESEERFRAVFDEAADGLLLVDPSDHSIVGCNSRVLELFEAETQAQLLAAASPAPPLAPLGELLAGVEHDGHAAAELQLSSLQGRRFWAAVAGRQVTAGGRKLHVVRFTDITQEKAAREALREREERLREQAMLLDAANDAIILLALDHRVLFWNRGAQRVFGWTAHEAVGRTIQQLYAVDAPTLQQATRFALEQGTWDGEATCVTKERARVVVESRWTLVRDPSGKPKGILCINTDVTEKKRIESRSLRAQRLESIGTLAGGIAHDLNNILAPIILSADMLRASVTEPGDVELIDTIAGSAQRGAEVVRQVLSFARGADSTRVPLNLRHLFAELRKITQEAFPRNISVETNAPHNLWTIMADPMQVHQVLLNLALNARDAMPDGGVLSFEVENVRLDATFAGLVPDAQPGNYLRTRVTDTGVGIAPEIRDRIFDPFFTTKGIGRHSGLGLSTAQAIVRAHGGFFTLESEVGRGSTFTVYLPAEHAPVPSAPAHGGDLPRGVGELVLVIDDEESVRSIIRQSLEGAGYRVLTAADGAEALSVFVQHRAEVALVLSDLMMPVMDGSAAAEALRRIVPNLRIVLMSGVAEIGGNPLLANPVENLRFLLKPFTLESLLVTVSTTLSN